MPSKVETNNDTPVSNQKVGETQSRVVKNIVNHTGVDKVDGGSSLMKHGKRTHDTRFLIFLLFQILIQIQLLLLLGI
jgi:hypothetical protein